MDSLEGGASLPVELWVYVARLLIPSRLITGDFDTLKALALTCRTLGEIAQPVIFEEVNFAYPIRESEVEEYSHRCLRLVEVLELREETRFWIKHLFLEDLGWNEPVEEEVKNLGFPNLVGLLERVLGLCSGLETLKIRFPTLSLQAFRHLWQLPRLIALDLHLGQDHFRDLPEESSIRALNLNDLRIRSLMAVCEVNGDNHIPSPISLLIAAPSIRGLVCNFKSLLTVHAATSGGSFLNLKHLSLNLKEESLVPQVPLVLATCVSLVQLKVSEWLPVYNGTIQWPAYPLPDAALPNIDKVEGTWELISWLVPRRNISTVCAVRCMQYSVGVGFARLSDGRTPVRCLRINNVSVREWGWAVFDSIITSSPNLEELHVECSDYTHDIQVFLEDLCDKGHASSPSLHRLVVAGYGRIYPGAAAALLTDERRRILLDKLRVRFTAIESININGKAYSMNHQNTTWMSVPVNDPRNI